MFSFPLDLSLSIVGYFRWRGRQFKREGETQISLSKRERMTKDEDD